MRDPSVVAARTDPADRLAAVVPRRPATRGSAEACTRRRWRYASAALLIVGGALAAGLLTLERLGQPAATRSQVGLASWYGPGFYGRRTASGQVYTGAALTAAHRSLPFGSRVRVTNLENGRRIMVIIDDRGPYVHGRVIDLSPAAARRLKMIEDGVVRVRVERVG